LELPEVYNNLGATLNDSLRYAEAVEALQDAVRRKPDFVPAYANLGYAYLQMNDPVAAVRSLERAVMLAPEYFDAHWLLSHAYLLAGRMAEGWREYEWRWKKVDSTLYPALALPRWDGTALEGKAILLFTEQGYGDAIQCIRYAPAVAALGGSLIVECQPELVRLFRSVEGIDQVIPRGSRLPHVDVQSPLMSLPMYFLPSPIDAVSRVPYLRVEPETIAEWEAKLGSQSTGFRAGLAWAGNPRHRNDINRSIDPELLGILGSVEGVTYFSLQKERDVAVSLQPSLRDLSDECHDFHATAALIESLDLVITVDTAVAHLAGALGKPVWTLLPYAPDWRWLLEREDTPWYPGMRLFRQPRAGAWEPVLVRVREELAKMAAAASSSARISR
jgi:hypothetical protein